MKFADIHSHSLGLIKKYLKRALLFQKRPLCSKKGPMSQKRPLCPNIKLSIIMKLFLATCPQHSISIVMWWNKTISTMNIYVLVPPIALFTTYDVICPKPEVVVLLFLFSQNVLDKSRLLIYWKAPLGPNTKKSHSMVPPVQSLGPCT